MDAEGLTWDHSQTSDHQLVNPPQRFWRHARECRRPQIAGDLGLRWHGHVSSQLALSLIRCRRVSSAAATYVGDGLGSGAGLARQHNSLPQPQLGMMLVGTQMKLARLTLSQACLGPDSGAWDAVVDELMMSAFDGVNCCKGSPSH